MKFWRLAKYSLAIALIFGSVCAISACENNKDNNTVIQGEKGDKGDRGDKGEDAVAPQIRINPTTNYWEVSTDNGVTWVSTGVKATGEKGDTPAIEHEYSNVGENISSLYDNCVKSVVKIRIEDTVFTGVVYKEDAHYAYILTSAKSLELNQEKNIDVTFYNQVKVSGTYLESNARECVAVIRVNKSDNYTIAKVVSDDSNVKIGDTIFTIGNPYNLSFALSTGVISDNRVYLETTYVTGYGGAYSTVYSYTKGVNTNNYGSIIFNSKGEMIGINVVPPEEQTDNSYSLPINFAIKVIEYELVDNRLFVKPILGISNKAICDYSSEEIATLGITVEKGLHISSSSKPSVPKDSIITHINAVEVSTKADLYFEIQKYNRGDVVELTIVDKNGENLEIVYIALE